MQQRYSELERHTFDWCCQACGNKNHMAVDADSSITWFIPIHYVQVAAPQLHPIWRRKLERDAWDSFKCLIFLASAFSLQRSPQRDLLFSCIHAVWSLFKSKWTKTKWACQSLARKNPFMSWLIHQSTKCGFWHLISELQKDSLPYEFLVFHLQTFILPLFEGAHSTLSLWQSCVPAFRILVQNKNNKIMSTNGV